MKIDIKSIIFQIAMLPFVIGVMSRIGNDNLITYGVVLLIAYVCMFKVNKYEKKASRN